MSDYKAAKEAFVADNPGGSVHSINAISLTALSAYALYAAVSRRARSPVLDWLTMVLPLLLGVTILSSSPLALNAVLVIAAALIGLPRAQTVQRSAGEWLNESDSDDDGAIPSPMPRAGLSVKLPSEVVAEVREEERERERVQLERTQSSSSSLASPTVLDHRRRRLSPTPRSAHTIDIGASPPTSPTTRQSFTDEKAALKSASAGRASPVRRRPKPTIVTTPSSSSAVSARSQLPFLTVYRAHMMVMTVHCILAVDFPIFPRVLGKCENFGTSLMDMGVGSFVFSLGIVSSKAFAPAAASLASNSSPIKTALAGLRKAIPVLVLGFIRLFMVKGVEYPEHLTEYGVHWNFFFTLGLVPVLASALLPLRKTLRWHTLAIGVALIDQLTLSRTPLQDFLLSPARPGLLGANKEGIASLPGYLAIFLLGLSAGEHILRAASKSAAPPSPEEGHSGDDTTAVRHRADRADSHTDKRRTELALELTAYCLACWAALGLCYLLGINVSRRFANLPYVLWVVAYNTSYLAGYLGIELWLFDSADPSSTPCPPLLDAVNRNSLVVFLAANLLTGLVNVSLQTMYAGTGTSVAVLVLYSGATCLLAWGIRGLRIKL